MKKIILNIGGMTCVACAKKIEKELSAVKGINSFDLDFSNNKLYLYYNPDIVTKNKIEKTITDIGYEINKTNRIALKLTCMLVFILVYFIFFKNLNIYPKIEEGISIGIIFLIGLTTSIHCVSMCGGICLSQCIGNRNLILKNSFLYNLGRISAYTLVGGIIGGLGSVFNLSIQTKSFIFMIAGLFMILMSINIGIGIPLLRKIYTKLSNSIRFMDKINKGGPFIVGFLNGFMPCGPLQSMQIYCLGTGSIFLGALYMFVFGIGTIPLMFFIGTIASSLNVSLAKYITKVSALLILAMGILAFSNGISLVNFNNMQSHIGEKTSVQVQRIRTEIKGNKYEPIVVKKDIPVIWTIYVDAENLNDCNDSIVAPKFGIEQDLVVGENVIKFTPTVKGQFLYSCWMGMIRSNITVE